MPDNPSDYEDSEEESLSPSLVPKETIDIDRLSYPDELKHIFTMVKTHLLDPKGHYGEYVALPDISAKIREINQRKRLIGISEHEEVPDKARQQGLTMDGVIESFVLGASGYVSTWDNAQKLSNPICLRSITKRKQMKECESNGRDYYYIDTGYFGNDKHKLYHRVTKNAMQWLGPIEDRPSDRLERTQVRIAKHTRGRKILICPPSEKAMKYWNLDLDQWMESTISEIKQHTDRPIDIRYKQPRRVRVNHDTMQQALGNDVHCMVTFNSIAAVESLIYGKPVFTMGPNAAHHLANSDLSKLESPFVPDRDQVWKLLCCLSYHQFTLEEMRTGLAWAILNGKA